MQFTIDEIHLRARVYLDDDHEDNGGFIAPESWLSFANTEIAKHYRDWIRVGLISPAPVDATFTSHTTTVAGVLATIGVAEDLGSGQLRMLSPAQSTFGRAPFWSYTEGTPSYWSATGTADSITYTLEPRVTGNYVVRYIPTLAYFTALTDTVDLPYGADERIVLGMARRAKLKDTSTSALLERLIAEADAQLNFQAFARATGDGPRVRRVAPTAPQRSFSSDYRFWRYS